MISAGFLDGKPMICTKNPVLPQNCTGAGYVSNKSSQLLRDTFSKLGRVPTMTEAASAFKAAIEDSSRNDLTVGGPLSILKLAQNRPPQWEGIPPSDGDSTQICDLVRARRGQIRPISSQQDLDQNLSAACPK